MERKLNPDQFFETDASGAKPQEAGSDPAAKQTVPAARSATDLFGTLVATPASEWSTVPETSTPVVAAYEVPVSRPPQPVVHEVVFKADPLSPEGSDPLLQLLRSAPPALRPVTATQPAAPAPPVSQPQVSAVASSGGFTQLLRALNYDQPKPEPIVPPAAAPVAPAVPPAAPALSITQLLRTIDHPIYTEPQPELVAAPPAAAPPAAATSAPVEHHAVAPVEVAAPVAAAPVQPAAQLVSREERVVAPEPQPGGSVGFTQMFQSLGSTKTAPSLPAVAPVEPAPPIAAPGSFTSMFETLNEPTVEPVEAAASQASPHPVVEAVPVAAEVPFVPPAIATPPAVAAPAVAAAEPGSFTRMFQTLDRPSVEPASAPAVAEAHTPGVSTAMFATPQFAAAEERLPTSPLPTAAPVVPEKAAPEPGSFTQMFRALDVQAVEPTPAEVKPVTPVAPVQAAGSFTQMFRTLDAAPEPLPPPPAAQPGSFTQMFQATAPPPVVAASSTPASASSTQMFRSLDAEPAPQPVVDRAPAYAPPSAAASPSSPGAFTQMFSTLPGQSSEVQREAPPAASKEGSFTQMFKTLSDSPEQAAPQYPPRNSPYESAPQYGSQPERSFGGVTSGFPPAASDAGYASPPSRVPHAPPSSSPSGGGLTQLLRTLDQPGSAPSQLPPAVAPQSLTQAGTFTSTYGTLDGAAPAPPYGQASSYGQTPPADAHATQAFRVPSTPLPQAPVVSAGPSEFTRILNASAFRESALRGGEPAAAAGSAVAPAAAAPGGGGISLPPLGAPRLPTMPSASLSVGGGGAHASVQGPHMPPVPHLPPVPQLKTPQLKVGAAGAGKVQQMLPLLLIMIIFLLVAILIAVIFLMKR